MDTAVEAHLKSLRSPEAMAKQKAALGEALAFHQGSADHAKRTHARTRNLRAREVSLFNLRLHLGMAHNLEQRLSAFK